MPELPASLKVALDQILIGLSRDERAWVELKGQEIARSNAPVSPAVLQPVIRTKFCTHGLQGDPHTKSKLDAVTAAVVYSASKHLEGSLKKSGAAHLAAEALGRHNRMLTLITSLLQMKHEGLKTVVQNMRA